MREGRLLSGRLRRAPLRALAKEPTVLAPRVLQRESRKWFALSAAASVAAVALVGWMAFAPRPDRSRSAQVQTEAAKAAGHGSAPNSANDYLLAHQAFSPRPSPMAHPHRGRAVRGAAMLRLYFRECALAATVAEAQSRRRSPGCARSTKRRRSFPTPALSSTRTAPQRDLAHHALRRSVHRHRARGDGRHAARDRTHQDTVRCYLPGLRLVKVDRRTERDSPRSSRAHHRARAPLRHHAGREARIAGHECQAVVLRPRDNLRYGYRLYADTKRHAAARGYRGCGGRAGRAVHFH